MKRGLASVALLVVCGCASSPAAAPAPDSQLAELQTSVTELLERIDVMSARLARLEETGATAAVSQPVEQRERAIVQKPAPPPEPVAVQQPQRAVMGAAVATRYREAIVLVSRKQYAEARKIFEEVLAGDPYGSLADNALFWIGETYFGAGDFETAIRFYNRVANEFAEENKAPDALFKTALALEKTGDLALARATLQQLIERYPYSSSASSAKSELLRIKY